MSPNKKSSSFNYNLSKPYPFTWFTPVVIVGGIIGLVLFSLVNLASNGYELNTVYVNDPNTTTVDKPWYLRWSWDQQLQPRCLPQDISVGSQIFTSNLGFTYTLTGVSRRYQEQNRIERLGSLSYLNQTLNDCHVNFIHFDLKKIDLSANGKGHYSSWDGSSASAAVQCTITDSDGLPVDISLSTQYKTAPADYSYVIDLDPTTRASMWWGTRLLNAYWYSLLLALAQQLYGTPGSNFTTTPTWMGGGMTFSPDPNQNDIKKYDFFDNPRFTFIPYNGDIENNYSANITDLNLLYNNIDYIPYSGSLTQALSWAKIMHSALLVDLGQTSSTTSSPSQNLLTDPDLLQYMLKHPDDKLRNDPTTAFNATRACTSEDPPGPLPCYNFFADINMFAPPGTENIIIDPNAASVTRKTPMPDSYDAFQGLMGPLGTKNTSIFGQYACQVPKRKPIGTMVITVLVADMVFLQACWLLLRLIADWLVKHGDDEEAMWCDGCSRRKEEGYSEV